VLSELLKYGGVAVKSKAIKSKQLNKEDYDQLIQKVSLSEVVLFLKNNTHYADIFKDVPEKNLHRGDIENPLKKYYASVIKKYYKFITNEDRRFLKIIFFKEEIEAIKDILRRMEGDKERFITPIDDYAAEHFSVDINKLSEAKNINEFMDIISGSKYEKILKYALTSGANQKMFSLEMALDNLYYKHMINEIKSKSKNDVMRIVYGTEIDMKNILWIYRCKKYYNVPNEIIYIYHIPYRCALTKAVLQEMINAEDLNQLCDIIKTTAYKDLTEGLEDGKEKKIFIENNYDKYFNDMLRKLKKDKSFSMVSVIEQLHSVNTEINKIINIVECIRYSMSAKEISAICQ